jgi:hypothetical protein
MRHDDRHIGETDGRFWEIVEMLAESQPVPARPRGTGHGPTVRCPRCGSFMALMHMGNNDAHACTV